LLVSHASATAPLFTYMSSPVIGMSLCRVWQALTSVRVSALYAWQFSLQV